MEWKVIVSFIMIGTSQHGFAVAEERFSSYEMCDSAIPGVEARVRTHLEASWIPEGKEITVISECVEDKPPPESHGP